MNPSHGNVPRVEEAAVRGHGRARQCATSSQQPRTLGAGLARPLTATEPDMAGRGPAQRSQPAAGPTQHGSVIRRTRMVGVREVRGRHPHVRCTPAMASHNGAFVRSSPSACARRGGEERRGGVEERRRGGEEERSKGGMVGGSYTGSVKDVEPKGPYMICDTSA